MNDKGYYVNTTESIFTDLYDANSNGTDKMGNYVSNVSESPALRAFEDWYKPIHGYLAVIVCVFGVIANILNIIVLTRKNMISATNIILTGLAIADGLTMAFYFPYALQMYVIHGTDVSPQRDTEGCATFLMSYAIGSVIVHSIAIWLTVTLAVFRYVFIRFPRRGARYCNIDASKRAVIAVCVVVTIVCIPNSITYEIRSDQLSNVIPLPNKTNETVWWIDIKKNTTTEMVLQKFNFWVQAILVKLLPCVFLTIFSILLIQTMKSAERRRKKMMNKNSVAEGETQPIGSGCKRSRRSQRTTRMLLAVVILFVVTETPQGILNLLSGLVDGFFHNVYTPMGDLLDILALINNGINFVLYCTMSKQFRDTFISVFCKCFPKVLEGRKLQTVTTMVPTKDSEV